MVTKPSASEVVHNSWCERYYEPILRLGLPTGQPIFDRASYQADTCYKQGQETAHLYQAHALTPLLVQHQEPEVSHLTVILLYHLLIDETTN